MFCWLQGRMQSTHYNHVPTNLGYHCLPWERPVSGRCYQSSPDCSFCPRRQLQVPCGSCLICSCIPSHAAASSASIILTIRIFPLINRIFILRLGGFGVNALHGSNIQSCHCSGRVCTICSYRLYHIDSDAVRLSSLGRQPSDS